MERKRNKTNIYVPTLNGELKKYYHFEWYIDTHNFEDYQSDNQTLTQKYNHQNINSKTITECELEWYAGGLPIESSILLLLKHAYGESDQLPWWLWRGQQVLHQRWISWNIHHIHLCQVQIRLPILVLKPTGNIIRSPKQGYQWPIINTCVHQNLLKITECPFRQARPLQTPV